MRFLLALLIAVLTACGGPTHEISARGYSTGIDNQALSRTTAENRALAELAELLAPDAVSFTIRRVGQASLFEVHRPETEAVYDRVELQPVPGGWMAIAFGARSPEASKAIKRLRPLDVHAKASAQVLEQAVKDAKERAFRQLVDRTVGARISGDGVFEGTVTLLSIEHRLEAEEPQEVAAAESAAGNDAETDGGETGSAPEETAATTPLVWVTVALSGAAKLDRTSDLTAGDRIAVWRDAAIQSFRAGDWGSAAEITSLLLELTPKSLPFVLLKASAQFHLNQAGLATETLSLAIMEAGGPDTEIFEDAFTELSKTVGADKIERLSAGLQEIKAAAEAAKSAEDDDKKKRKKRKK